MDGKRLQGNCLILYLHLKMSKNMKSVLILMSTYNGGDKIQRQVESILNQESIEASLLIRDDGSDEYTKSLLREIEEKYNNRIQVNFKMNEGWKLSFMDLIQDAPAIFDYYGFADQDDIWMPDKLISCIQLMEEDDNVGVKLTHCNSLSVDTNLNPREEQEKRVPCPPNYKAAIATEYFQGCGMVWNKEAMKLLQKYRPKNITLAHDYWVGLICYLFGKIYFCNEPKFYHIRYGNNQSSDGNRWKGRIIRIKNILNKQKAYMNPAEDLIVGFKSVLDNEILTFLTLLSKYRSHKAYKLKVLTDREFRRPTLFSTLLFKYSILVNKY